MTQKLNVFLDPIGRTILGNVISSDNEQNLVVENPVLVNIQPNPQNGQLQLQMIPLFFKELLDPAASSPCFIYPKSRITTMTDTVFAAQFINQYKQLTGQTPSAPEVSSGPEIVQLFDEQN
jgi:hypothetical protein